MLSVLEQELRTECFVSMIFAFIFTYAHFSTSFLLYRGNKITLTAISTQFILYLY